MKLKKILLGVIVAGMLTTAVAAYAAEIKTPAQIVSELTGKTVEQVTEERSNGTTYGAQAIKADKTEEFKSQMLEQKKAWLADLVKQGKITQAQADERLKAIEERIANCDGTGSGKGSCGLGLGQGNGFGQRGGKGQGRGMGRGMGSCINQ